MCWFVSEAWVHQWLRVNLKSISSAGAGHHIRLDIWGRRLLILWNVHKWDVRVWQSCKVRVLPSQKLLIFLSMLIQIWYRPQNHKKMWTQSTCLLSCFLLKLKKIHLETEKKKGFEHTCTQRLSFWGKSMYGVHTSQKWESMGQCNQPDVPSSSLLTFVLQWNQDTTKI